MAIKYGFQGSSHPSTTLISPVNLGLNCSFLLFWFLVFVSNPGFTLRMPTPQRRNRLFFNPLQGPRPRRSAPPSPLSFQKYLWRSPNDQQQLQRRPTRPRGAEGRSRRAAAAVPARAETLPDADRPPPRHLRPRQLRDT